MSTRSLSISSAPASRRERSSRSTASFCRRSTCSAITCTNSSRVWGSSCSSWSSSTKPASEKIGVRSSCEAFAMNSRRARSTWRSFSCISLNACARRPSSSFDSIGSGSTGRPAARSRAASSTRRTRRVRTRATSQPPTSATISAAALAISRRLRTSVTAVAALHLRLWDVVAEYVRQLRRLLLSAQLEVVELLVEQLRMELRQEHEDDDGERERRDCEEHQRELVPQRGQPEGERSEPHRY